MTDVEGAIGLHQLDRLDKMLSIRRRNAATIEEGLENTNGIVFQKTVKGGRHSYHQLCVAIKKDSFGIDRDQLAEELKRKGIATGVHYPRGLNKQPVFEELYGTQNLTTSDILCGEILALPVHHGMTQEQCFRIVDVIKSII